MVVNNSLQSLSVEFQDDDIQQGAQGVEPGGAPLERIVTIHNRGAQPAEVEIWLEPADSRAELLRQWGVFSQGSEDLTIEPRDSETVVLKFLVPVQAEPGFYAYDVRVRSPQYPGKVFRRSQQLQVVVTQQGRLQTDPQITLEPATTSTEPHLLPIGTPMALVATVENTSRRTDRFFLSCLDVPSEWVQVTYPQKQPKNGNGAMGQTHGLLLNPKESGQIQLHIHPPYDAPPGNYSPTVRISSNNRPELVLFEIVYFTISLDASLGVEMHPTQRKLPAQEDFFEVLLTNPGNIPRHFVLAAIDEENSLNYVVYPSDQFFLAPGDSVIATLQPLLPHRWRQLWRRRAQTIDFRLDIQNLLSDPLVEQDGQLSPNHQEPKTELTIPDKMPVGQIIWKAKRRWLFRLLMLALGLGIVTGLSLILWHYFVWKPSLRPMIAEFVPMREEYQASVGTQLTEGNASPKPPEEEESGPGTKINEAQQVAFKWQVTNPKNISELRLLYNQLDREGAQDQGELRINLLNLESYSLKLVSEDREQVFPGEDQGQIVIKKTDNAYYLTIVEGDETPDVENRPLKKALLSKQTIKRFKELSLEEEGNDNNILKRLGGFTSRLFNSPKREIKATREQIQKVTGSLLEERIPSSLKDKCDIREIPRSNSIVSTLLGWQRQRANLSKNIPALTCTNMPVPESFEFQASISDFGLEVSTFQGDRATKAADNTLPVSDRKKIEKLAIAPPITPSPEIFEFIPSSLTYGGNSSDTVSTGEAPKRPSVPVKLNWAIGNVAEIQSIRVVGRLSNSPESIHDETYIFDTTATADPKQKIPSELNQFCTVLADDTTLLCRGVPGNVKGLGEYIFYLTVTPTKQNPEKKDIVQQTAPIAILSAPPEIVNFSLNGKSNRQQPKHIFVVNPDRGALEVELSWQVENATKVELLPAPGEIKENSLLYTISPTPGSEVIVLRAVNDLGEEVMQSIAIETVEFSPTPIVTPEAANNAEASGVLPPPPPAGITVPPTEEEPGSESILPPAGEPPRAN